MRWLLIILVLLNCETARLSAAGFAETRAFNKAAEIFSDQLYSVAEANFAEFLLKHPNSEYRAEAVLYQAKARFFQNNFKGAIELLESQRAQAGRFADQYDYWLAQSYFQSGKWETAAEKYGDLIKNFPGSPLVLEASYNQSFAFSKLANWRRVIELLSAPESDFQKAIRSNFGSPVAVQGLLLLGEALFIQGKLSESETVLKQLEKLPLSTEGRWRQQYLLSRVQVAAGRAEQALVTSSNLLKTATGLQQPRFQAETAGVRAQVLEKLGRLDEAVAIYEQNLGENLPQDFRRQALFKTIELTLLQNKTGEAITRLEKFSVQYTNDAALDLALLTLGELRLKQFFTFEESATSDTNTLAPALTRTNLFEIALTNLNFVISNFPGSDLLGRAFLNRGWCFWVAEKFEDAGKDFGEAVNRLPVSEDQAVARFKLADTQFRLGHFTNAVANYGRILRDYTGLSSVTNTLFDQALYQIVRSSIGSGDHATAQEAMRNILIWYPNTGFAERGLLLVGQELNKKGNTAEARKLFSQFAEKFSDSPLLPEVKLAIARTFVQERNWEQALAIFDEWTAAYPNHLLLPHAEFSRALTTFQSGHESNAFNMFTNFIERYPSNSLTPLAENWLGDFYANRDDLLAAEAHYQLVGKYNPPLDLACRAKMNAGRAAWDRQDFKKAAEYFARLVDDTNTPPEFQVEAYFALGDSIYTQIIVEKLTNDFSEVFAAFNRIIRDFPTNALVPLAWGKVGECYLQLYWSQTNDTSYLEKATNAFQQVLESPLASVSARNQAEVGLGMVFEALGQPESALNHYVRILYVDEKDEFDPVYLKKAGLSAARLYENKQQWKQAVNIYERLQSVLPSLKQTLEKKILIAKTQSETQAR